MSFQFFPASSPEVATELDRVKDALQNSKAIVGLIGAGASVSAGMDDFRQPASIFRRLGGRAVLSENVYGSREMIGRHHALVQYVVNTGALIQPTPFHQMFNGFAMRGRLTNLLTQNIDGLETRLPYLYTDRPLRDDPYPPPNTLELHGNANFMYCVKCHWFASIRLHLFYHNQPPECPACVALIAGEARDGNKRSTRTPGWLRPWILLYDHGPDGLQNANITRHIHYVANAKPDLLIVGGTKVNVPGAMEALRSISAAVRQQKGLVVWISTEKPKVHLYSYLDIIMEGTCDQLAALAGYTV